MAGEKILLVDDEADVLDLCKRILESKAYQVKPAHNGREAIDFALQESFDLLLTDIKMPGMSGLEIAQVLKEADPGIICVIMTGYSTMDMAIEAVKLGIDEFVMKPFSPEELSLAIAKALEKQHLRKENFRLRSLIPLFELNKTLMSVVEVEQFLDRLLDISRQETSADFAGLFLLESENITATFQPEQAVGQQRQEVCRQLAEMAMTGNEQLSYNRQNAVTDQQRQFLEQMAVQSVIVNPLRFKEANLGALVVVRTASNFDPSDVDFLAVLSGQASIALENARLFTATQDAYKELQVLDHMKSEFINIAAHELRTPLAILMGYAAVLEDDLEGTSRDYISHIMRNAMRLRAIIDDMLSLQYLESGIPNLSADVLLLPEIIDQVIQDMDLLVKEKNLTVFVDIPRDFPELIADRQKFDLIVVNLVHNAMKFTPPGEQVGFRATANGEYATISVTNTGVAIPKDKMDRIFDRFYQVESSLTREHGGIGLGLAIVRGMVEVCGGKISVESDETNGTTFTFTLPLDNTSLKDRLSP